MMGGEERARIENVSLSIMRKTLNVIRGPEGSGKTLLLRLLGLLEAPDSGELFLHEAPTRQMDAQVRAGVRNQHFGFMFADPFLLPSFSVLENVAMPLLKISAAGPDEARVRTLDLLEFVELPGIGETPVEQLSLGQQHRVALARALVNQPQIVVAENLDANLSGPDLESLCEMLHRAIEKFSVTVLLSAISRETEAERVIEMTSGAIARDSAALANW